MAIPDYQSIMLPLLQVISDGGEHKVREIISTLAEQFALSDEEQTELLPSGQQPIFDNRVGWAKTYLKKAGLLQSPRRAVCLITDRGLEILKAHPATITVKYLKQFPEFVEFQETKRDETVSEGDVLEILSQQTPEELIDNAYRRIRNSLAQDLLNRVMEMPPTFFERLVVELLVKMGYGGSRLDAGKAIGKSGDEGIDGTIKEDKLGLDVIYIQAKRWKSSIVVGRPEIQKFVGALAGQGAKKGIFITTSTFSAEALAYSPKNETKIVLLDGEQLAELMIDHNLGVTIQQNYEIKRVDNDFFED